MSYSNNALRQANNTYTIGMLMRYCYWGSNPLRSSIPKCVGQVTHTTYIPMKMVVDYNGNSFPQKVLSLPYPSELAGGTYTGKLWT